MNAYNCIEIPLMVAFREFEWTAGNSTATRAIAPLGQFDYRQILNLVAAAAAQLSALRNPRR